jgi:hypothetical protein
VERLRRALRGVDRAESPALPVGEALHPLALAAVVVLVVNDWVLKPRWHGWLTGKLSDVAGLAFAPVLLSAVIGLILHVVGAKDPSLSRRRLVACCAATAAGFAVVKLCAPVREQLAALIGHHAEFYPDPSDLLALPAVLVSYWIGRDELRRVPLGRPAAIHRLGVPAAPTLADTSAPPDLAPAIDAWDVARIDAILANRP